MKRLLGLSCLTLALASCGQQTASTPPSHVTVNAGTALSVPLYLPTHGQWSVEGLPAGVKAEPSSGRGWVMTKLSLTRPALSEQRSLTGEFKVRWSRDGRTGETRVTINADMFRLAGRVGGTVSAASDATTARPAFQPTPEAARGVIVKYKTARALAQALSLGASVSQQHGRTALITTTDTQATLRKLQRDPNVEYAVPNVILHPLTENASDQYAPLQWAYPLTGYTAVWQDMQTAPYRHPVTVAVLDTGVRFDHPDLQGGLWGPGEGALDLAAAFAGGEVTGPDDDPTDPGNPAQLGQGSHGTHVAGIIAARWGKFTAPCPECSDSGVIGATRDAPVKVLPVRVLDAQGGDVNTIANGIRYAAGLPITLNGTMYQVPGPAKAQVINLSLGGAIGANEARPLCEAISDAKRNGALVIAAAGNNGDSSVFYPAACLDAVSVASVSLADGSPGRAYYSNANASVTLSAPGGDDRQAWNGAVLGADAFPDQIFSTSWNYRLGRPNYEAMVGTSQAAPQVAALAALLLSKGEVSSSADALRRLQDTATDLGPAGRDDATGYGMINAAAALNAPTVELPVQVTAHRAVQGGEQAVTLKLDALGRFEGFVREGDYRVQARRDTNQNGIYGEPGEPRAQVSVNVGPGAAGRDVGTLDPR